MKLLQFSFREGGWKGYLAHHAEKLGLALALTLVIVLFAIGYTDAPKLGEGESPEKLAALAASANSHINAESWEVIKTTRTPRLDHADSVEEGRSEVEESVYSLPVAWGPPLFRQDSPRRDPDLYAPEKLEVTGMYAAVLRPLGPRDEDPWYSLPYATVKIEQTPAAEPAPRATPGPMPIPEMPGSSGYGSGSGRRRRSGGSADYMAPATPSATDPLLTPGAAPEVIRALSPWQRQELQAANAPGGAAMGPGMSPSGPTYLPGGGASSGGVPTGVYIVAVKALVPLKKQSREFEAAFLEARGYAEARDKYPRYLYFYAERAEVSDDPAAPLEWRSVSSTKKMVAHAQAWLGAGPELADYAHLTPELTAPLPPILLRDYSELALHEDIPRADLSAVLDPTLEEGGPEVGDEPGDDEPGADPMAPGMYGSTPGMPGAGRAPYPSAMPPASPGGSRSPPMYGGSGSGIPGMYGAAGTAGVEPPDNLLLRFFDTEVEEGKKYVYRVKVLVEDPNFIDLSAAPGDSSAGSGSAPMSTPSSSMPAAYGGSAAPGSLKLSDLTDEVVSRLRADAKAAEAATPKRKPARWRETEWSEVSPVHETPALPRQVFASTVTPPKLITLGENGPVFVGGEPKCNLLAVVWDPKLAVDTPAKVPDLERGAYLDFSEAADILNPQTLEFKKHQDPFKFDVGATVLDMDGGERLGGARDTSVYSGGSVLLLDRNGELLVRSEFEDEEDYRRQLFIEDNPAPDPAAAGTPGMVPGSAMPPGYSDLMGSPGGSPSGSSGSRTRPPRSSGSP